jgi:hypothetical protein
VLLSRYTQIRLITVQLLSQAEDDVDRALPHREEVLDRRLERVRIVAGRKLDVVALDHAGKEDSEFQEGQALPHTATL